MKMQQLESTFCDLVRTEDNGKRILIGVYRDVLYTEFPATLPTFSILVSLVVDKDSHPKDSLVFKLIRDDEVLVEQAAPPEMLKQLADSAESAEENTVARLAAEFNFGSLKLEGPCVLRVRALIDGEEIRAAGLRVQQAGDS